MHWWLRKKCALAWGDIAGTGVLLGLLVDFSAVADRMSAITSVGGAVLSSLVTFGIIFAAGTLGTWFAMWSAKWVPSLWNDGPSVKRFRALAPQLRALRTRATRHYENRGGAFIGSFPTVSEGASISADFSQLFNRLAALKILVFEALSYRDDTPRGRRFWVAYLANMEHLARWGSLKSARNPEIPHLTWHSGNVIEGSDAEGPIGASRQESEE